MGAEYEAAIDKWLGRVQEDLITLARQSIFDLVRMVVFDTPVHVGFLRGNWQPAIGAAPPPKDGGTADPSGSMALADATVRLQGLTLQDTFYFTNATAYARRVNYGFVGEDSLGRHYNQAGQFYLENNLAKWPAIVAARGEQLFQRAAL